MKNPLHLSQMLMVLLQAVLGPFEIKTDDERIKKSRPKIAEMLFAE
jgi:hypothetical protein